MSQFVIKSVLLRNRLKNFKCFIRDFRACSITGYYSDLVQSIISLIWNRKSGSYDTAVIRQGHHTSAPTVYRDGYRFKVNVSMNSPVFIEVSAVSGALIVAMVYDTDNRSDRSMVLPIDGLFAIFAAVTEGLWVLFLL